MRAQRKSSCKKVLSPYIRCLCIYQKYATQFSLQWQLDMFVGQTNPYQVVLTQNESCQAHAFHHLHADLWGQKHMLPLMSFHGEASYQPKNYLIVRYTFWNCHHLLYFWFHHSFFLYQVINLILALIYLRISLVLLL